MSAKHPCIQCERCAYRFCVMYSKSIKILSTEHIKQSLCLFLGNGDALAHLIMLGRPGTDIVNRLSLIPADKVKLYVNGTLAFDGKCYLALGSEVGHVRITHCKTAKSSAVYYDDVSLSRIEEKA